MSLTAALLVAWLPQTLEPIAALEVVSTRAGARCATRKAGCRHSAAQGTTSAANGTAVYGLSCHWPATARARAAGGNHRSPPVVTADPWQRTVGQALSSVWSGHKQVEVVNLLPHVLVVVRCCSCADRTCQQKQACSCHRPRRPHPATFRRLEMNKCWSVCAHVRLAGNNVCYGHEQPPR